MNNNDEDAMKYPIDNDEFKALVKEAIKEWLEERWAEFGKWTARGLLAAMLAAAVAFILWVKGLPPSH